MSEYAKLSITVKAGSNSGDPWVVIHAGSVDEAHSLISELLAKGVLAGVRQLSDGFHQPNATPQQAVAQVMQTFPGAQVVSDTGGMWAGTNATPQQPANGYVAQPNVSQQLPAAQGVPCSTCGGPTQFKSGVSSKGKAYKGHFCLNDRDHAPVWG
jgi:hypothetical protein